MRRRITKHKVPLVVWMGVEYDSDHGVGGRDEECIEERLRKEITDAVERCGFSLHDDLCFEFHPEARELYEVEKEYEPI